MGLEEEVTEAAKRVVTDGYEMSLGELMNLYRDKELIIRPEFQRLFRWDDSQKTKFIESLLLGIPIPPVFVSQREDSKWELVDGLQRLSTVFEFTGILDSLDGGQARPLELLGTQELPSLDGMRWNPVAEGDPKAFPIGLQIQVKRARMRVEILKKESDLEAKYELFQRLNTGGSPLSPQEVRNCVMLMVDKALSDWIRSLSESKDLATTFAFSEKQSDEQKPMELAFRFVAYHHLKYKGGLDVNEYLDRAVVQLSRDFQGFKDSETVRFNKTFGLLSSSLGVNAFKRWDGRQFTGQSTVSSFDAIAHGVAENIDAILQLGDGAHSFVETKVKALWTDDTFSRNSGQGVRGTTRLANLLPLGEKFFKP